MAYEMKSWAVYEKHCSNRSRMWVFGRSTCVMCEQYPLSLERSREHGTAVNCADRLTSRWWKYFHPLSAFPRPPPCQGRWSDCCRSGEIPSPLVDHSELSFYQWRDDVRWFAARARVLPDRNNKRGRHRRRK